jgi:hypothetical protein
MQMLSPSPIFLLRTAHRLSAAAEGRYRPVSADRQDGAAGWVRVLGEDGRRPAHLRGLPGLIPAEPHTEVADHVRGSQGSCGVGCA